MGDLLMTYKERITEAMNMLATVDDVIFLGQGVQYGGNIYGTLDDVSRDKKIELPIMEEVQMGMSIGLALEGYLPVTIYPRMDFLLLAMNQLVNHLDKIEEMSRGEYKPKVIIRTIVGSDYPLDPGLQHKQDYTDMLKGILTNIDIIKLTDKDDILPSYTKALNSDKSTILVEMRALYDK